jgi:hypothetical protein
MVAALTGLSLAAPILRLIVLVVRVGLGTPVLFRQQRPSRGGWPFMLLKCRTMTAARDEAGELLPDDQRMTPFGRFLRRCSPDELPAIVRTEGSPEFDEECSRRPNGKVTLTFGCRMFGAPAFPDAGRRLHRIVADGAQ